MIEQLQIEQEILAVHGSIQSKSSHIKGLQRDQLLRTELGSDRDFTFASRPIDEIRQLNEMLASCDLTHLSFVKLRDISTSMKQACDCFNAMIRHRPIDDSARTALGTECYNIWQQFCDAVMPVSRPHSCPHFEV